MADDFFIKLKNATDLERDLLEISQETISIIELQKKLVSLREEKQQSFFALEENLRDVKKLLGHLEMLMPKSEIPKQKIKAVKNEKLDEIERELGDIDKEMDALKKAKKR